VSHQRPKLTCVDFVRMKCRKPTVRIECCEHVTMSRIMLAVSILESEGFKVVLYTPPTEQHALCLVDPPQV
jgi:hypothetical protein